MFLSSGYAVTVYTFCREYYRVNQYPDGAEVVELGKLKNERYWGRLPRLMRAMLVVRRREIDRAAPADVVYCFGFDSGLLGLVVSEKKTPIVYEVGDIRRLHFSRSVVGRIFQTCERALLRRSAAVVVTAPAFVEQYYAAAVPVTRDKAVVVENRLPEYFEPMIRPVRSAKARRRIRIGVVGFLRYACALLPLLRVVATRHENLELHVYGDGPLRSDVERAAAECEHIFYHGPFKNPTDLAYIYSEIDLNYVVYDNSDWNVRLALPNKLYESMFFGVPMIVASETALAERVREAGVGIAIDPRDQGVIGETLDRLDEAQLEMMSERARAVPASKLVENRKAVLTEILRKLEPDRA